MKLRLRYSLRTLLLSTLLAGAIMALWRGWEPWALRRIPHDAELHAAHFSSDGKWLLTFVEKKCLVRNMPGATLVQTLPCDDSSAAWSCDNRLVALSLSPHTIIWDAQTWQRVKRLDNCRANGAVFSPDSKRLISFSPIGDFGNKIHLWNIDTAARIAEFSFEYRFSCFSSNSRHLVLEGAGGKGVVMIDTSDGTLLWGTGTLLSEMSSEIIDDVSFTAGDAQLIVKSSRANIEESGVSEESFVRAYETRTGALISKSEERKENWKSSAFIFFDGGFIARISIDGRRLQKDELDFLKLTDSSGKFLGRLPEFQLANSKGQAEFSPDGRSIIAANYWTENDLYLWSRQHPEYWWGLACLPAFWLVFIFGITVLWSFIRDQKVGRGSGPSKLSPDKNDAQKLDGPEPHPTKI